jgi:hypothetical protein
MHEIDRPPAIALREFLRSDGFTCHPMIRNQVGHLQLTGLLVGQQVEMIVDTGAASTVVDLAYCQAQGLALRDTGLKGGGAGGTTLAIHALENAALTIDGATLRSNRLVAIDLSHVNHSLRAKGAAPIQAVLGADILLHHQAVIDYATGSLYLKRAEDLPAKRDPSPTSAAPEPSPKI